MPSGAASARIAARRRDSRGSAAASLPVRRATPTPASCAGKLAQYNRDPPVLARRSRALRRDREFCAVIETALAPGLHARHVDALIPHDAACVGFLPNGRRMFTEVDLRGAVPRPHA